MTEPERPDAPREATRARMERAALDLFTLRGFENVTIDEVADAAGISRRTFFRYFATKADAVWGDFAGARRPARPDCCATPTRPAGARVDLRRLRRGQRLRRRASCRCCAQRMQLILTEPALLAHSQVRYADVDRVVAEHVAPRTGRRQANWSPGWWRRARAPPRRRRSRPGWPIRSSRSTRRSAPRSTRSPPVSGLWTSSCPPPEQRAGGSFRASRTFRRRQAGWHSVPRQGSADAEGGRSGGPEKISTKRRQ